MEHFLPASMARTQSKKPKNAIEDAQQQGKPVHFATLMDSGHLKKSDMDNIPEVQRRVVLRGDAGKDDSGSYAVFIEQDSSASHMPGAEVKDVNFTTARLCSRSQRCFFSSHSCKNGRCSQIVQITRSWMPSNLDTRTTISNTKSWDNTKFLSKHI